MGLPSGLHSGVSHAAVSIPKTFAICLPKASAGSRPKLASRSMAMFKDLELNWDLRLDREKRSRYPAGTEARS